MGAFKVLFVIYCDFREKETGHAVGFQVAKPVMVPFLPAKGLLLACCADGEPTPVVEVKFNVDTGEILCFAMDKSSVLTCTDQEMISFMKEYVDQGWLLYDSDTFLEEAYPDSLYKGWRWLKEDK